MVSTKEDLAPRSVSGPSTPLFLAFFRSPFFPSPGRNLGFQACFFLLIRPHSTHTRLRNSYYSFPPFFFFSREFSASFGSLPWLSPALNNSTRPCLFSPRVPPPKSLLLAPDCAGFFSVTVEGWFLIAFPPAHPSFPFVFVIRTDSRFLQWKQNSLLNGRTKGSGAGVFFFFFFLSVGLVPMKPPPSGLSPGPFRSGCSFEINSWRVRRVVAHPVGSFDPPRFLCPPRFSLTFPPLGGPWHPLSGFSRETSSNFPPPAPFRGFPPRLVPSPQARGPLP